MTLVRRTILILLAVMMVRLLGAQPHSTFGQTPSTEIPHIGYGESLTLSSPTFVWLDVTQGDVFTLTLMGVETNPILLRSAESEPVMKIFSWQELTDRSAVVYHAEKPGPYLWTYVEDGMATITLERGDSVDIERGPIAIGDTVSGAISGTQMDIYTIDLLPDSELTLHLTGECNTEPDVLLPGLEDAEQLNWSGSRYYVIPPDLAGTHQIYVKCDSGEYTLSVAVNDLWLDKGSLALDTPVSGMGTAGYFDRYLLDIQPGDVVTVWTENAEGNGIFSTGRNGNGEYLRFGEAINTDAGMYQAYWANGDGPYWLYVLADQAYTISMKSGVELDGAQVVRIGESIDVLGSEYRPGDGLYTGGTWLVDVPYGSWITVRATSNDAAGLLDLELLDALGTSISPMARFEGSPDFEGAFYLASPGPYRVNPKGIAPQNFTMTVTDGNQLMTDRGPIEVGQLVEDTAEALRTIQYTLSEFPSDEPILVKASGVSHLQVTNADGEFVEFDYINSALGPTNENILMAVLPLDSACPCQLTLNTSQPNYSIELGYVPPEAFPGAQLLTLGEAVSGDVGDAWMAKYHFEIPNYGDLVIRLQFDPSQTDSNRLFLQAQYPGQIAPGGYMPDQNRTEYGEDYILFHYPVLFPGEYTLQIINLHGPYTLTATLQ